jgi:hypothetical protein
MQLTKALRITHSQLPSELFGLQDDAETETVWRRSEEPISKSWLIWCTQISFALNIPDFSHLIGEKSCVCDVAWRGSVLGKFYSRLAVPDKYKRKPTNTAKANLLITFTANSRLCFLPSATAHVTVLTFLLRLKNSVANTNWNSPTCKLLNKTSTSPCSYEIQHKVSVWRYSSRVVSCLSHTEDNEWHLGNVIMLH